MFANTSTPIGSFASKAAEARPLHSEYNPTPDQYCSQHIEQSSPPPQKHYYIEETQNMQQEYPPPQPQNMAQVIHLQEYQEQTAPPCEYPQPQDMQEETNLINDIEFDRKFRGYNTQQVDDYIQAFTQDYNSICRKCAALEWENEGLRWALASLQTSEIQPNGIGWTS